MSIYIGPDINNNKSLIISTTASDIDSIKSYSGSIAYSSQMNYLEIEEISHTGYIYQATFNCSGWYYYGDYVMLSQIDVSDIVSNNYSIFITLDNILISGFISPIAIGMGNMTWFNTSSFCSTASSVPLVSSNSILFRGHNNNDIYPNVFSSSSVCRVYKIKNIKNNVFIPTSISNDIIINNSSIIINGHDLSAYGFISLSPVDVVDNNYIKQVSVYSDISTIGFYMYIIDQSKIVGSGVEIHASSYEQYIKVKGRKLFSSISSSSNIQYSGSYYYLGPQIVFSLPGAKILLSNLTILVDQLFFCDYLFSNGGYTSLTPLRFPMKYKDGKIAFLGQMINVNDLRSGNVYLYGYNSQLYMMCDAAIGSSGLYVNSHIYKFST